MKKSLIHSLSFKLKLTVIILLFCFKSNAQGNIPTVGTDFWMCYMSNYGGTSDALDLFISGNQATSGTISSPLQGWSTTFNITPGQTTTITIPEFIGGNYIDNAVGNKGIHIESDDTISVFAINFRSYSADGTIVLPIKSLGTEYIISSFETVYGESEFAIVATEDGTEIEITPSVATTGGNPAGVPFTVQLDEGETYQVKANIPLDLTGTKIVATEASGDCRPFAVFSGVVCANIPTECVACDHVYDQNYPIDTWGKKYYIVPFLNATSYTFRILARDDNTTVTLDDGSQIVLNAGQFSSESYVANDQVIEADKPISIIQYMEGIWCAGSGDPAMLILNSEERKIDEVTFSTVTSSVITNHSLNVIVETSSVNSVMLDGALVNASSFTPFTNDPLKSYARLNISQGSHNLYLPSGFTAYSYGTGDAESYAYGVGSFMPQAQIPVDTAYCSNDSVVLSSGTELFEPWWSTNSNPTDTIFEGNVLVLLPPLINEIYIVTGNSLVSGCTETKYYSVESPTPPVLNLTISDDTVCKFADVQFTLDINPISSSYTINWEPGYMFNDPHAQNPVLSAQQSGWYKVSVSTLSGCGISYDSVYVEVLGGGVKGLTVSTDLNQICAPDTAQLDLEILQILQFDDFDVSNNTNLWATINGSLNTDTCDFISGDALYFYAGTNRFAETNDFDVSNGGEIEFYLKIANSVAPCDNADNGENVLLQYSIDGGTSWNTLATYFENNFPNFTLVNEQIPIAAQTSSTRFRIIQPVFSAIDEDVWMIENFSLSIISDNGLNITWSPSTDVSNNSITNPQAFPVQDTWFVANVASGSCEYKDSIFISAGSAFTLQTTGDISLCSVVPIQLSSVPNQAGNYDYLWTPNIDLTSNTSQTTTSNTTSSIQYYVTVTSDFGCQAIDSVNIYFASQMSSQIIGDTSICIGDTTNLMLEMSSNLIDDFNTPFNTNLWSTIGGGLLNTSCGSVSGNALHYNSASGTRFAQTLGFNTLSGGTISFSLIIGSGTSPCEDADPGEDVILEYSINNGLTWIPIQTFLTTSFSSFTDVNVNIPPAAMTNNTMFRWNQPSSSGTGSDNWAIDDVSININSGNSNFTVEWIDENNQVVSTDFTLGYTPNQSTMFYVVLTDTVANCQTIDSVYLIINTFSIEVGNDTILCPGTQFQINAQTSLTNPLITWSNAANLLNSNSLTPTIINEIPQYYTLNLQQGTCSGQDSIFIDYYQTPNLIDSQNVYICIGDTFDLELNFGSNYNWNNQVFIQNSSSNSPSFFPNAYTEFIVDFEFGDNCLSADTFSITVVDVPSISLIDTIVKCPENSVSLSPIYTNVDQVLWSNSQQTNNILVSQAGTYVVEGMNLCRSVFDSVVVMNFDVEQVFIGYDTTICYHDSLTVFPINFDVNTDYIWSNGSSNITQVLYGNSQISIEAIDANSCRTFDTLNLSLFPVLNVTLGPDIEFCSYDQAILQLNNPDLASYFWSTGDTTQSITVDIEGNYAIFTRDYNSCHYMDTIFVDEIIAPSPNIVGTLEYCPDLTTNIGLTTTFSEYLWSTGETTQTIVAGAPLTQIWVQVTNQFNCIGSDTVYISEIPVPDIDLGPDIEICPSDLVQFNAEIIGANNYLWSTGEISPIVSLGPGSYGVEAIFNTCVIRDSITILASPTPSLELGLDFVICPDESFTIAALASNYDSIIWHDGTIGSSYYQEHNIMFDSVFVTATAYGCGQLSDSIAVYVENCNCIIYVPNTFTPDGNNFNNTFEITHLCEFLTFQFIIFNRWGELIFQTNDPNFEWPGTGPDGGILQDGTYTWSMIYQSTEDSALINQTGFVNILQ